VQELLRASGPSLIGFKSLQVPMWWLFSLALLILIQILVYHVHGTHQRRVGRRRAGHRQAVAQLLPDAQDYHTTKGQSLVPRGILLDFFRRLNARWGTPRAGMIPSLSYHINSIKSIYSVRSSLVHDNLTFRWLVIRSRVQHPLCIISVGQST